MGYGPVEISGSSGGRFKVKLRGKVVYEDKKENDK